MHPKQAGKQTIKTFFSCILLPVLILVSLTACQSEQILQQRFLQFGTVIDITLVTADPPKAHLLFDKIEWLLKKRHIEWHGWEDGTLKRFNLALQDQSRSTKIPDSGIEIPPALNLLISDSKNYYALSGGLFNPALGKLIDAWGFHSSKKPNLPLINRIKTNIPGMDDLVIHNNHATSLNPFLQLDFGAIAKGLAVKQIADLINQHQIENFIINAGGDIFAQGRKPDNNWRIAIENPFADENMGKTIIGSLEISEPASIFTSGNYRRFYLDKNQKRRHHIINPLTGEPSENISSITVLHKNPVKADVAATTLMLTNTADLSKMAEELDIQDYLAITEQHEIYMSPSMSEKTQWLDLQTFKIK